jgi:hypothetical protein
VASTPLFIDNSLLARKPENSVWHRILREIS